MARRLFRTHRSTPRDRSLRRCSLQEFQRIAQAGIHLCFAADTSLAWSPILAAKLKRFDRR